MKLWDFRQMAEIQTIEGFDDVTMSACWSYSGNLILTATRDGIVRLYDPRHNSSPAGVTALLKPFGFPFLDLFFFFPHRKQKPITLQQRALTCVSWATPSSCRLASQSTIFLHFRSSSSNQTSTLHIGMATVRSASGTLATSPSH